MFKSPKRMSDDELEREYKAIETYLNDVLPDENVSDWMKEQSIEHSRSVIEEYSYRRNGEYMVPLSMFGIVDF